MLDFDMTSQPLDSEERLQFMFAAVAREPRIALAVSGGVDSLALMVLAKRWADSLPKAPELTVFSVDHGLRDEAKDEVQFVKNFAHELGIEAVILTGTIDDPSSALQAKARALRYGLMGEAMAQRDIDVLLTAHHLDDQAETVLMRLARGSGVSGMGGMAPFTLRHGITLARPLLHVTRSELEAFIGAIDVEPINDPSNHNMNFERVRWRKFMPALNEAGMSAEKIGISATRLRRADQALIELTETLYEQLFLIDPFGCVYFETDKLLAQPAELGIRLLFRALDDAGGENASPTLTQIEKLYDHITASLTQMKGVTIGGCGLKFAEGLGQIFREVGRMPQQSKELVAGMNHNWDNRFHIIVSPDCASPICVSPAIDFSRKKLDSLLPGLPYVPIEAVRSAPVLTAGDEILAIGEHAMSSKVDVFRTFGPNALM
jgi:tRNA(Ile)-lysidine synthase